MNKVTSNCPDWTTVPVQTPTDTKGMEVQNDAGTIKEWMVQEGLMYVMRMETGLEHSAVGKGLSTPIRSLPLFLRQRGATKSSLEK